MTQKCITKKRKKNRIEVISITIYSYKLTNTNCSTQRAVTR